MPSFECAHCEKEIDFDLCIDITVTKAMIEGNENTQFLKAVKDELSSIDVMMGHEYLENEEIQCPHCGKMTPINICMEDESIYNVH